VSCHRGMTKRFYTNETRVTVLQKNSRLFDKYNPQLNNRAFDFGEEETSCSTKSTVTAKKKYRIKFLNKWVVTLGSLTCDASNTNSITVPLTVVMACIVKF
jgi:hypothetical protein